MEEYDTKELCVEKPNKDQNENFDLAAALLAKGYIAEDSAEFIHSKTLKMILINIVSYLLKIMKNIFLNLELFNEI